MSDYRRILERADAHFASVMRSQPKNLECGRGCSLCCHGLFEIGSGDVPMIADGLSSMTPESRNEIICRALEIVRTTGHPNLRECSPAEKELYFEKTDNTPCPILDGAGACMLYEHRPLVCRTFGLPLRDGSRYLGDICDLNFQGSSRRERDAAAWDLAWEDAIGPEDEFTIPEAIVLVARLRGWIGE